MENNNKKTIRVENGSIKKPSDPNKKVVRKVIKVIDEKDLKNVDLRSEVEKQNEALKNKKLEEKRKELLKRQQEEKAALLKKQEEERKRLEAERLRQQEELRRKKEAELRRQREEERKRLEEQKRREAEKAAKQARIEAEKRARAEQAAHEKEKIERARAIEKQRKTKEKEKKKEERKNSKNTRNEKTNMPPVCISIWKIFKIAFVSGFITMCCGVIVLCMILYSWSKDIPVIDISELGKSAQTSFIYDINGNLITTYSGSENREWVELEDMPDMLVTAFLTIEDKRFYSHGPIDSKRFIKAILGQVLGNDNAGGSTITQQLVKNVYLTNEVTYKRKWQEIVLANSLEKQMSKDEILEAYLNIIYFGSSNYGVSVAAKDYFGKELDELSLREIAMLAGIPKNPNGYNPRRNTYVKNDMKRTNERTDNVLWVMHNEGVISDFQYESALKEEVPIQKESRFFEMYDNAHAVEYTMKQVIADLLEERELENNYENRSLIDNEIRNGGYNIYTSIDPVVQKSVQDTVETWNRYPKVLDAEGEPIKNEDGSFENPQVAAVVIQPNTGYVLAMVGSRQTPVTMKTLNRAITNEMPVASTIKPLSIYAPCIDKGLYPSSVEYNFKTYIEGYDDKAAYPGGQSPESAVSMRQAVEQSYNIAAVRFLVNNIGYELSEDYLIALGIDKEYVQKNGSGLALGTSGINMLELTAAYNTLASGGCYYEPKGYIKVTDRNGNIVLDSSKHQARRQIFTEESAWLTTDMLISTVEEGNSGAAAIPGIQVAGKTGTHQNKCALFAGYTGDYVSCIWIGSDGFSDLSNASGGKEAAPVWKSYMEKIYALNEAPKKQIYDKAPDDTEKKILCADSGMIAGDNCPDTFEDYSGDSVGYCNMHVEADFCGYSGLLTGDDCPADAVSRRNAMIVPSDSSLAMIPDEIIKQKWPNAYIATPEHLCDAHYNGRTIPTETQIGYSKNLVGKIQPLLENEILDQQYKNLLNADLASINNMIARAENALYNGVQESDNFYVEYFDEYNRVKTDIQNIQGILSASQ